jgi:hypothetical protein
MKKRRRSKEKIDRTKWVYIARSGVECLSGRILRGISGGAMKFFKRRSKPL